MKNTAIVLAAGSGSRMKSNVKKQYMEILGYPLVYYTLKTFQESFIDEIVLVVSPGDEDYCRENIVKKYGFTKVKEIVPGGSERYLSVFNGLKACRDCEHVFIQDGARAFTTEDILKRCLDAVSDKNSDRACVAAVKSKDTMKLEDGNGFVKETLNRNLLWSIQTPQVFEYNLITDCYKKMIDSAEELDRKGIVITDDTMAVEYFSDRKVKLVEGSYDNIKVTTVEDVLLAEEILKRFGEKNV